MRDKPSGGLPAERTLLAWDRTTLGVVANGALVLLNHAIPAHPGRVALALAALLLALLCAAARRSRRRRIAHDPHTPATAPILLVGLGITVFAVLLATLALTELLP